MKPSTCTTASIALAWALTFSANHVNAYAPLSSWIHLQGSAIPKNFNPEEIRLELNAQLMCNAIDPDIHQAAWQIVVQSDAKKIQPIDADDLRLALTMECKETVDGASAGEPEATPEATPEPISEEPIQEEPILEEPISEEPILEEPVHEQKPEAKKGAYEYYDESASAVAEEEPIFAEEEPITEGEPVADEDCDEDKKDQSTVAAVIPDSEDSEDNEEDSAAEGFSSGEFTIDHSTTEVEISIPASSSSTAAVAEEDCDGNKKGDDAMNTGFGGAYPSTAGKTPLDDDAMNTGFGGAYPSAAAATGSAVDDAMNTGFAAPFTAGGAYGAATAPLMDDAMAQSFGGAPSAGSPFMASAPVEDCDEPMTKTPVAGASSGSYVNVPTPAPTHLAC